MILQILELSGARLLIHTVSREYWLFRAGKRSKTILTIYRSFYNQEVFMSKVPSTLKAALVNYPRRAIVTGVVHDEVAQFGASLDVPFTRHEPIAPELTVSWHKTRVAWKMQNTISGGHPAWETVGYASSLPCGWIPDSASDFLATFILDVEQGWILFLDHADEYLAHQVCYPSHTLCSTRILVIWC
jgi:hypothetical protein